MKQLLPFTLIVVLTVVPASGGAQGQPQPVQQAAATSPTGNELVCQKEAEIGSRLGGHKICHTRAEWRQLGWDSRAMVEGIQRGGAHEYSIPDCPPGSSRCGF